MREALDEDIDGLRELLGPAAGPSRPPRVKPAAEDADYDQFVRTLAFEARAKPKDRTRTEEELALEEKEKLEEAEAKRLRRMRGEESEEEGDSRKRKRAAAGADDLDDDYVEDEEGLLGPGLTREDIENMGTLGGEDVSGDEDEEDGTEGEEDDDEEDDDEEDDEEDEDDDEEDEDGLEDLDEASEAGSVEEVVRKSKGKAKATNPVKEIPYTFPCPTTIDELEDILDEHDDAAVPVIIQRIRALHHPSLAQGNKEKLQVRSAATTLMIGISRRTTRLLSRTRLETGTRVLPHINTSSPSDQPGQAQPDYRCSTLPRQAHTHAEELD
jgi:nucleolar protein 14